MNIVTGKKYTISGMTIEIMADEGGRWKTRNLTTKEMVFMNKSVLENAIKLGKAEEIPQDEDKEC